MVPDNPSEKMLKTRILHSPRFVPLRIRYIFLSSLMLLLILGVLAVALGLQQRHTIRSQLEQRGLAIAHSLASSALSNMLTYNYVALESSANQAARDPDLTYVIFHDKEGRVAGYSGRPDLQNTWLSDPASKAAVNLAAPLIQEVRNERNRLVTLDVAVPVFPPGVQERWGTVRIGLSLDSMYHQIRQTQWIIAAVGVMALVFGVLISLGMAQRITRPLAVLVAGTQAAARGDLNRAIDVHTGDEVEILASNFAAMIREILAHREQLEKRLIEIQRLQRYTERLLTTMSDGLMSVDLAGAVSTVNPAAYRILSLDPQAKPPGGFCVSWLKERFPELGAYIEGIQQAPGDHSPREIYMNGGRDGLVLLVGCGILKDREGHPQQIILNLHDITELKKLETSMRQAERLAALGTLAAGMAHEIRNPLSAIKTFVQLLPRKVSKPGFLEKFQRTVPRELERINQLVEDLLELSRTPNYSFNNADIRPLILQRIELMEEELHLRQVRCHCDLPETLPFVRVDARQLAKAFHNLISNALQAMPAGGALSIDVALDKNDDDKSWVRISFADTGPGIRQEEIKNIFNPFFTTKDGGTGLGLSITHKVVVEHGGRIEVDSKSGEGARFIIKLPVSAAAA